MAFPSATGTTQDNLSNAWEQARHVASNVKSRAQSLNTASAAGPIQTSLILSFASYMADAKAALTSARDTPGIGAYAQEQINDPVINLATEFNAMMAAIDATVSWVIANFPADGNGWLLHVSFNPDNSGNTQYRTLSSAQTAGMRTQLLALIATIN